MTLKTLPVIFQPQQSSSSSILSPFSWLFLNCRRRFIFLTICSPLLLPLLCLLFPVICLCQLYFCLCRRHRRLRRRYDAGLRRCEEGRGGEIVEVNEDDEERELGWMLLQRYLEDQLGLVGSVISVYDCGDDDDDDDDFDIDRHQHIPDDTRTPFLN
ncbi:uncharacterized protein LOC110714159 [Chenopodium quinoa]|uniref:uncharacterized protein LOC110714159 n=1 Tax=Chenopodium quinoa TaxID=63459 RepID=UPI000B797DD5|nr:uncharacterized protein LOC110714159 [Chenopodium quinoa]